MRFDGLDAEYYRGVTQRLDRAERTHDSSGSRIEYLRSFVLRTQHLQAEVSSHGAADEGRAFSDSQLLMERRESIDRLLGDFIGTPDTLGDEMPGDSFLFQMEQSLAGGKQAGKLNTTEGRYLHDYLTKTRHVRNDFSSGGWTTWKKMLYLERTDSMERLMRDFLEDDFNPVGVRTSGG